MYEGNYAHGQIMNFANVDHMANIASSDQPPSLIQSTLDISK